MNHQENVYHPVRSRLHEVGKSLDVNSFPSMTQEEWCTIDSGKYAQLVSYIQKVRESLQPNEKLDPDSKFDEHLKIMRLYIHQLWSNQLFREFCIDNSLTLPFLLSLVEIHDLSRNFVNGAMPLTHVDNLNSIFVNRLFSGYPEHYLHSIHWITEKNPLQTDAERMPVHLTIAVIMKTIDTLGKTGESGGILHHQEFFASGGMYEKWIDRQVANKRLPFTVVDREDNADFVKKTITAEQYAANDKRLTLKGIDILQSRFHINFAAMRAQVELDFRNESPYLVPNSRRQ